MILFALISTHKVLYQTYCDWNQNMLRLSKLTDYATVILSFLALDPTKIMSAAHVAREVHLTRPTVSKLLKILLKTKLVVSCRGVGGGYRLARPAQHITLSDIVFALEGPVAVTECCAPAKPCAIDALCAIKENWQVINHTIVSALARLTLQDMTQPLNAHPLILRGIPIKTERHA